jgi:DinB superfamily
MTSILRIPGFRGEFLWELDIVTRQSVGLAQAFPAENYGWRPDPQARAVSEVFLHVAAGNFMLLDALGFPAPADVYREVPSGGHECFVALIRQSDEFMASLRDKDVIGHLLQRSFQALHDSIEQTSDSELDRGLHFFGEDTTVRRVYLRLRAHAHEHMGQMIAYLRANGIAAPGQDWRPDRRAKRETPTT